MKNGGIARGECRLAVVGLLVLVMLMLTGCSAGTPAPGEKPTAVASIFSYYDALRAIGGSDVESVILLPPGQSPHEYQGTVKDKALVEKAGLIIKNGLNIDTWMDRLAAGNTPAIVIDVSAVVKKQGIQPLQTLEISVWGGNDAATQGAAAEDVSQGNPHIWLDPRVQAMAAEAIRDALVKLDPAHKDAYTQRAEVYLGQLKQLDADFAAAAAKFAQKDFIGFHSAYAYMAQRYGLNQVASVEELPDQGPTIAQTLNIIKLIRDKNIKVIFMENALQPKPAQMIADQTHVKTGVLQPIETYDNLDQSYVSLMRENLEALKKALD